MSDMVVYCRGTANDFSSSGLAVLRCALTMDSVIAPEL